MRSSDRQGPYGWRLQLNVRPVQIAVALVLLATAVACTDDSDPAPQPPEAHAVWFVGDLNQSRPQEGTRTINAHLTSTADHDVTVTSIELETDAIAALAPTPKDTTFTPGRTIDVTTEYGDPECEQDRVDEASFIVRLSDGTTQEVPLTRHGKAWLNRLYVRECGLAAIADIATFSYGDTFSRVEVGGETYLGGDIVVQRAAGSAPDSSLTVRELSGSVLIKLLPATPDTLPVDLEPGDEVLKVPVLLGSFRCDSHALADSTQTFLLSTYVTAPGLTQQRIIVVPDHALQVMILALIDHNCDTDGYVTSE